MIGKIAKAEASLNIEAVNHLYQRIFQAFMLE
jgi:hypothetical protein